MAPTNFALLVRSIDIPTLSSKIKFFRQSHLHYLSYKEQSFYEMIQLALRSLPTGDFNNIFGHYLYSFMKDATQKQARFLMSLISASQHLQLYSLSQKSSYSLLASTLLEFNWIWESESDALTLFEYLCRSLKLLEEDRKRRNLFTKEEQKELKRVLYKCLVLGFHELLDNMLQLFKFKEDLRCGLEYCLSVIKEREMQSGIAESLVALFESNFIIADKFEADNFSDVFYFQCEKTSPHILR